MVNVNFRSELIEEVKLIATKAGLAIMDIYQSSDFGIEYKNDTSPLTKADQLANDIIIQGLSNLPENFPVISEENTQLPFEERKNYDYCWMVDPLDGTKEFIKKNDEFTVNIALIYKNQSVLGVVYVPVTKEIFWAVKNQGAFLTKNGETQKLFPKPFKLSDENLKVVCSKSHINEGTKALIATLKNPIIIPRGSSLKFLDLASGTAQLYPRVGRIMEWDSAAAHIIVEESGGELLDLETKIPLKYNKENLSNPDFWATANTGTKISAVLITKNEAKNIYATLEALHKVVNEIIIIDSRSTDETVKICESFGAKIYQRNWIGYAQNKNIGNDLATHDWILSIDGDEVLSDELIETLKDLKLEKQKIYALDRINNYCGTWIKHGEWYPDWKPRLFNKEQIHWEGDFVHETLAIPDNIKIEKLNGKLFHYSYISKDDHIQRMDKYANLAAKDMYERKIPTNFIKIWISPVFRFFKSLIIKKGVLDGQNGFEIAYQEARTVHNKYSILKQKHNKKG